MMQLIADSTYKVFGQPVSSDVFLLWLLGITVVWLSIRLQKDRLDRLRIADFFKRSGSTVVLIEWNTSNC